MHCTDTVGGKQVKDNCFLLGVLTLHQGQRAMVFNIRMFTVSARAQACKILPALI